MTRFRPLMLLFLISATLGSNVGLSADEEKPTSKKDQTQEVVAEGVGSTADEAIKDAYRNAVRQVVGAVVDAETLVKNDELIDDKVLTYSDGFIKTYEEVDGSKKVKGGLHRIKIKAQVERRGVIAKLKAANVTMKAVDGKGLFAEAVTELDAEKNAAALLKKQFEGFPQSCIAATVIGKPKLLDKKAENATVEITVQVDPDLKAYKAFSERITTMLDKLSKTKGEFTGKFGRPPSDNNSADLDAIGDGGFGNIGLIAEWIPKAFDGNGSIKYWKKETLTLAVATSRTKTGDRIDYRFYQIDTALQPILVELATRMGQGKLQLLNDDGETIATERFKLRSQSFAGTLVAAYGCPYGDRSNKSELGLTICRDFDTEFQSAKENAKLFLLSPTFFVGRTNNLSHLPQLTIPCKLTLSLDELKSVKDAKVEVTFDE